MKKITKDKNGKVLLIKEYDDNGNKIHYKDCYEYEELREYDDKGRLIHVKDSNGYEEFYEYID